MIPKWYGTLIQVQEAESRMMWSAWGYKSQNRTGVKKFRVPHYPLPCVCVWGGCACACVWSKLLTLNIIGHASHILDWVFMGLRNNDLWAGANMWPLREWGQRSSRGYYRSVTSGDQNYDYSPRPYTLLGFHGTWKQRSLGRGKHMAPTWMGSKVLQGSLQVSDFWWSKLWLVTRTIYLIGFSWDLDTMVLGWGQTCALTWVGSKVIYGSLGVDDFWWSKL